MEIKNMQNLVQFANSLRDQMAENEKLLTARLAVKFSKAAQLNPTDQPIIQMASFLGLRAAKSPFITKAELFDVYKSFWSKGSRCENYLQEELGPKLNPVPDAKPMTRNAKEGTPIVDVFAQFADKQLVSEFESAFDKTAKYKPYNREMAKLAETVCAQCLPGNPKVEVVDGRDFAMICQATYETPKGKSGVLIPIEITNGRAFKPTMFLSQAGFVDLSEKSITEHLTKTAGKNYRVDTSQVLDAIHKVKFASEETDEIDDVDRIVMAVRLAESEPAYTANGILYQTIDPEVKAEVQTVSPEAETFAQQLGTTAGAANFMFGERVVRLSYSVIDQQLKECGYKNSTIKIASYDDSSITFAVNVGGAGFKVPVKASKTGITPPTMILANGSIESFDSEGITNAIGANDQTTSSMALGYNLANPAQLLTEVEAACACGNIKRAGEALTALQLTGDEMAYKGAFATYMDALNNDGSIKKAASNKPQMKIIRVGGRLVEATTGLPADKVYMDENGEVQASYRRNMDKTDSSFAAGFMNAKILMGM